MTTGANALPTVSNNAEILQTLDLVNDADGCKFIRNDTDNIQAIMVMPGTYNTDISDLSSLTHHPFKFYTTPDGMSM